MKLPPDIQKLEQILRSSVFSAMGFMGSDNRSLIEIIEADAAELTQLGMTKEQLADKMQQITDTASTALENWVDIDDDHQAKTTEAKGRICCPWPHRFYCPKRITILRNKKTDSEVIWSDLNIHLIRDHSFFEGKGSPFRIEPQKLIEVIT